LFISISMWLATAVQAGCVSLWQLQRETPSHLCVCLCVCVCFCGQEDGEKRRRFPSGPDTWSHAALALNDASVLMSPRLLAPSFDSSHYIITFFLSLTLPYSLWQMPVSLSSLRPDSGRRRRRKGRRKQLCSDRSPTLWVISSLRGLKTRGKGGDLWWHTDSNTV